MGVILTPATRASLTECVTSCREKEEEDECAECCNCGDDVSNDNGTGSLVEGEYWCKTCVEEKEE